MSSTTCALLDGHVLEGDQTIHVVGQLDVEVTLAVLDRRTAGRTDVLILRQGAHHVQEV